MSRFRVQFFFEYELNDSFINRDMMQEKFRKFQEEMLEETLEQVVTSTSLKQEKIKSDNQN